MKLPKWPSDGWFIFEHYGPKAWIRWAKKHHRMSKRQKAVNFCREALKYKGQMVYVEYGERYGQTRSSLFHRRPGDFRGAGADCSQFVSSIMHWCGVKNVTDQDATGSLLAKGRVAKDPAIARLVIFGPGSGRHVGMLTEKKNGVWYLVEFGMQSAPDKVSLPAASDYFRRRGIYGVRIRDFF